MYLTFDLNDDLDHDISPLNMCGSVRYKCMPNMKLLSAVDQMSKLDPNKQIQTNKQTGQNNMSPIKVWST